MRIEEGHLISDHVHIMISIPPICAVTQMIGFIKCKSTIHIAPSYSGRKRNFVGQHFWARGYFVSTAGRDERIIREYVSHQERQERRLDQLDMLKQPVHQRVANQPSDRVAAS